MQSAPGRLMVNLQGNFIGQMMTDKGDRHLMLLIELRFKRKQCQHQIHRTRDFMNAFLPPGPYRRTDIMNRQSEEHTSELQSRENLVCRLLLEKKKKYNN